MMSTPEGITSIVPLPSQRLVCDRCCRPRIACICQWAIPITSSIEVVILQHPLEVQHPKGSARLLHLSLPGSRLVVGEAFAEEVLHELLYLPFATQAQRPTPKRTMLLYPETDSGAPAAAEKEGSSTDPATLRLIVLDGTWRKSRKMLYLNPLLQRLPRLSLKNVPPSRYAIRRAHQPHQLSTLEACCHALAQVEEESVKYQPLLHAFDALIVQQKRWYKRTTQRQAT